MGLISIFGKKHFFSLVSTFPPNRSCERSEIFLTLSNILSLSFSFLSFLKCWINSFNYIFGVFFLRSSLSFTIFWYHWIFWMIQSLELELSLWLKYPWTTVPWTENVKTCKCEKFAKRAKIANQPIRESVCKRVSSQGINQTESLISWLS